MDGASGGIECQWCSIEYSAQTLRRPHESNALSRLYLNNTHGGADASARSENYTDAETAVASYAHCAQRKQCWTQPDA